MASSKSYVRTRILILSDTHCELPFPATERAVQPYTYPLPKADVLLHAGDLTGNGRLDQHRNAAQLLHSVEAQDKFVIMGNHDLTMDDEYYQRHPYEHCDWPRYSSSTLAQIKDLYTGPSAVAANIHYLTEGTHSFKISNGAKLNLYASSYTPEFFNWGFGYPRSVDRFNPGPDATNPVPDSSGGGVDIMLTHGPPLNILDETSKSLHVGCDYLRRAVERCKPKLHAFGHIHEAWGAVAKDWATQQEKVVGTAARKYLIKDRAAYINATELKEGEETLFVNASIMDLQYDPKQAPWLVDLMLPRAE